MIKKWVSHSKSLSKTYFGKNLISSEWMNMVMGFIIIIKHAEIYSGYICINFFLQRPRVRIIKINGW